MRYVGFDIGGTKCAVSIGESDGARAELLARRELFTPNCWRDAVEQKFALAEELIRAHGPPAAAGFSCGGPLDSERGVIQAPPNLSGWAGVPIVEMARARLQIPAFLENDANACALAEWRWGAGTGARNVVFMTFGTGMGAGLILDGRLCRGANGNAGEVGHIRLAPFGPAGYGKEGSFEGFCSGGGIAQLGGTFARRAIQRGETPSYWREGEQPSARDVADAARQGDRTALEVIEYCGKMLGQGLAVVIDLLNPDRVILGSIYTRCEDLFAPVVQEVLARECLPLTRSAVRILPARLGEAIGDFAALCVAEYGLGAGRG